MRLIDEVVVFCTESFLTAYIPELLSGGTNNYYGENLLQNILYNMGFQFTAILDLIFVDYDTGDPFWYYVFSRLGDFAVRFFFRDEDPQ
jgi:hypothetical protein